jgi:hypothetical protein
MNRESRALLCIHQRDLTHTLFSEYTKVSTPFGIFRSFVRPITIGQPELRGHWIFRN